MTLIAPVGVVYGLGLIIAMDVSLALGAQLYARWRLRGSGRPLPRQLRLRSPRRLLGGLLPALVGTLGMWGALNRSIAGLEAALGLGLALGVALAAAIGLVGTIDFFVSGRARVALAPLAAAAPPFVADPLSIPPPAPRPTDSDSAA